jgi:hypothetical protein
MGKAYSYSIFCPEFDLNRHASLLFHYHLFFSLIYRASSTFDPPCHPRAVEYALSSTGIEVLSYHGDLNSKERSVLVVRNALMQSIAAQSAVTYWN